jgi:hypothetical protein
MQQAASTNAPLGKTFQFLRTYSCACLASDIPKPQKQCQVLKLYGFYYDLGLNAVICPKDRRIVLLDDWLSHIKESHKTDHPGKLVKAENLRMKMHVADSFGPHETRANIVLPSHLPEPLFLQDYFSSPRPSINGRYFCPVNGCGKWISVSVGPTMGYQHALDHHVRQEHKKRLEDCSKVSIEPIWTQSIMLWPGKYHHFSLPVTFSKAHLQRLVHPSALLLPAAARYIDQEDYQEVPPQDAHWMNIIGWPEYRTSIGAQDYDTLRALVAIPGTKRVKRKCVEKWLEDGLLQIHHMCTVYLSNAYESIKYRHHGVQAAITEE